MATAGKAILAILAGKGKPMPVGKPAPVGDDEDMDSETAEETDGDSEPRETKYMDLLERAFPDENWPKDRVDAFVEFIHQCMDEG